MKYFLITSFIIIFLSGCTTRSAFSHFNLDVAQEIAIEHTRSGKIMSGDKLEGIYSVIYLNNADKSTQRTTDDFYISVYLKDSDNTNFILTMNQQESLYMEKLQSTNKYSHLLPHKRVWSNNFIIKFKNTTSNKLTLKIGSGQFSSGPLDYLKDQL